MLVYLPVASIFWKGNKRRSTAFWGTQKMQRKTNQTMWKVRWKTTFFSDGWWHQWWQHLDPTLVMFHSTKNCGSRKCLDPLLDQGFSWVELIATYKTMTYYIIVMYLMSPGMILEAVLWDVASILKRRIDRGWAQTGRPRWLQEPSYCWRRFYFLRDSRQPIRHQQNRLNFCCRF